MRRRSALTGLTLLGPCDFLLTRSNPYISLSAAFHPHPMPLHWVPLNYSMAAIFTKTVQRKNEKNLPLLLTITFTLEHVKT